MIIESIDRKLDNLGYKLYHIGSTGFTYLKQHGAHGGTQKVCYTAESDDLLSYDPEIPGYNGYGYSAVPIPASELIIFYKKIKEWRKTYGSNI